MTHSRTLAALTLVAAVAVVYHPAASAYFFDDDFQWLVGTWSFHPANLVDFASLTHFYRPVIDVYFAVATPLFGGSPASFHVANIVLHAANGLLVYAFAQRISRSAAFSFLTALFFVVQPADVDAIAWVGALAEPVSAFFGLLALLALLRCYETGLRRWHVLSVAAFLLALLTHESSVVFLPLLVLTAYIFAPYDRASTRWRDLVRVFAPFALVTAVYLALDLWINSRNYVVAEGHYRIGMHVVSNALHYVVGLYVGRRDPVNYGLVALILPLLLLRGTPRVRFAACWLLLAMAPFVLFTWGTQSRYFYLPSIGFAMLLADGVLYVDRLLASVVSRKGRAAASILLASAITIRFMVFALDNVETFAARTETYRRYGQLFRQVHGPLVRYSRVDPDDRLQTDHEPRFVTAMIQWEYRDPTIEVIVPDKR
jgi:hypothetical protein